MEEKMKVKKHIIRKLLFILLIILVIFIILTLRKFIIYSKIQNIAKDKINSSNYYVEKISLQGKSSTIVKSYNKDSKYLTTHEIFGTTISEKRQLTVYENKDEKIGIIQSGENKIAILDGNILGGKISISTFDIGQAGIFYKILLAATSRITSEECNNKKCYLVEPAKGWKLWIDKETGIVVREINGSTIQDSYYEFNVVKDEDIVKPDISDCKIQ